MVQIDNKQHYMAETITPPITYEPVSHHETPEGQVTRVTLSVHDSEGIDYSLVVFTPRDHIHGDQDVPEPDDDEEPAFMLPVDSLTPDNIDEIMTGMAPSLLGKFVVRQID